MKRRQWLRAVPGAFVGAGTITGASDAPGARDEPDVRDARASRSGIVQYPALGPGRPLVFPRDFGAHPEARTEWWYLTGWLDDGREEFGVQVTFFRTRTAHDERDPSRFAPKQLLFAHAALALPGERRLRHDQRAARAGFANARFDERDTDLRVLDWRLARGADDRYRAEIVARDFRLALAFAPPRPPVPQGDGGYSRKGPRPEQASMYYSRPQLRVSGTVARSRDLAAARPVTGLAWLDHEWSSEILDADAVGWDWTGLNFDDGSALMAFRIRGRDGGTVWSHARWAGDPTRDAPPRFEALREWRSPRTGARYPCAMRLSVGKRTFELAPLFDDQELDARASTGTVYWEGAVRVLEAGRAVGRGYLELTGYAGAVRL